MKNIIISVKTEEEKQKILKVVEKDSMFMPRNCDAQISVIDYTIKEIITTSDLEKPIDVL